MGTKPTLYDEIVAEWVDFAENIAPVNDDAAEYCATHPLHVPLRDRLFTTVPRPITLPTANKVIAKLTQTVALDSVQWSRRGQRRDPKHIANKQSRGLVEETADCNSESSSSGSCDYEYVPLNQSQKSKFKSYLKYVGKNFVDTADGERIESCVHAIVMEKSNKTLCFEYYENDHDEKQYIVADFAIDDCQWIKANDNIDSSNSSSDDDQDGDNTTNKKRYGTAIKNKRKKQSRGWYYLDDDEDCAIASLEEAVHCPVDAPRKLRNSKRI